MARGEGSFDTPGDLAALLEEIGMRLHGKNRMAMGESGFAWELAEAIRGCGVLVQTRLGTRETEAEFGDGYEAGSLRPELKRQRLLDLLGEAMAARR